MTDALFDLPPADSGAAPTAPRNEAKRSIDYVTDAVLEFGKVGGVNELLDRVATLCRLTRYKPYNCLLILLQRPGATVVLLTSGRNVSAMWCGLVSSRWSCFNAAVQ